MAIHGYVTHAARNRRMTSWFVLAYVFAFEIIGAFVMLVPLMIQDYEHSILANPAGYALRYGLPMAAVSGLVFWFLYRSHASSVVRSLDVRLVERLQEPRFVALAEQACTSLGVRLPRFGVIEQSEPNALSVGEEPASGLIAVTRGLLERLDDDELAAVLAHEASHIRHGDTRLLAANHALMRTAVMLQTHNPLRIEDWRQLLIPLFIPAFLPILLASGAATMLAMQLARLARRMVKLGRDHIADAEAVRVTHYPDALMSATLQDRWQRRLSGQSAFGGATVRRADGPGRG